MSSKRAHVILPEDLVSDIDALVGRRRRSAFLAEIAGQEVRRRRLLRILERARPAWRIENHPELKKGAAAWVARMRGADEKVSAARTRRRK